MPFVWLLVSSLAPLVCLFCRGGWWNTPDNPTSPHGQYEPQMRRIRERFGTWVADYWWLGFRNRAQGLAYALKPAHFKNLTGYEGCEVKRSGGVLRVTDVDGYKEYTLSLKWFHVLYGYRVGPIYNEVMKNRQGANIPFRAVNMDARPVISIRSGKAD